MQFEISERIRCQKSERQVMDLVLTQMEKVSEKAELYNDGTVLAKSIEATFGSINRKDETRISAKKAEDGWLIVASVQYRPSFMFWVFVIAGFFLYVGWLVPIVFYLLQKSAVRKAVEDTLRRVSNELNQQLTGSVSVVERVSAMDELEKLASLRERGFVSDEEFAAKKLQLLRA